MCFSRIKLKDLMISKVFSTINDSKITSGENSHEQQFIKSSVMLFHYIKEQLHSDTTGFIWVIEITSLKLNSEVPGGYYSVLCIHTLQHTDKEYGLL